jgi:hypothetical protein
MILECRCGQRHDLLKLLDLVRFHIADSLRKQVEEAGYKLTDLPNGKTKIEKI